VTFEDFWNQAVVHHGSTQIVESYLPDVALEDELTAITDAQYLSTLSRRVFRAGMKHSVVDSKWPAFEEAFWGFDPIACQLIDDARFELLMQNTTLIRHWGKMKTIPINAAMVAQVAKEFGSFGAFIAQWPTNDIVNLWQFLKKNGSHLGGDGGSRFLRMVGKDTFVLTDDVTRALINAGVVTKKPTSQRDLAETQDYFNQLAEQSERSLSQISMILALSIGPN
jgi:3-methyladenine DNA glycosylase Tag